MGMVAGRMSGLRSPLLPEGVDHRRHQAQHAAGALELHQGRPVGVEAVEDLGVDGVGGLDALLVVGVAALGRELRLLSAVELGEGAGDDIAVPEVRRVGEGLEEAAADDLEALFGGCGPPGGLQTADDVAQAIEGFAAAGAADLDVVGLGVGRAGRIGGGEADDEEAVAGQLGGLGEGLGEAELGLEGAGREIALVVELAGVGDPLVDRGSRQGP